MNITRTIYINDLTPQELATAFSVMRDDHQAEFFNALASIVKEWAGAGWCQQCSYLVRHLDHGGTEIIAKLAEWAADPKGLNV